MAVRANLPTLIDVAKATDPDGKISALAELLSQTNEILEDAPFIESNLPTGHQVSIRTGLPETFWRAINEGVPSSKSTRAQLTEGIGMLETWADVDVDLANLNGNVNEFRLSEATAFLEAMNQEMASTIFYGNSALNPKEFMGLAPRYNAPTGAGNSQNVLSAGSVSGSDGTSIWLVGWGPQTLFMTYPKGSRAGLIHENLGIQTIEAVNGVAGTKMRAYQDHYQWKAGMVVKDWRYAVRIANIDTSAMSADATGATVKLLELMLRAVHRIPNMGMCRPVFYANRDVRMMLDIQALNKAANTLKISDVDGTPVTEFRGIPIKTCDALMSTEGQI
jgi:hypothetical protein